jgi:hypothetical protein
MKRVFFCSWHCAGTTLETLKRQLLLYKRHNDDILTSMRGGLSLFSALF